jgi:hypothetical protein
MSLSYEQMNKINIKIWKKWAPIIIKQNNKPSVFLEAFLKKKKETL